MVEDKRNLEKYGFISRIRTSPIIFRSLVPPAAGQQAAGNALDSSADKLRHGYRIEGQTIYVYEDRPRWDKLSEWLAVDFAKLRYTRRQNIWKLYWKRASGKWGLYEPKGESRHLSVLVGAINEDKWGFFFG